jgi:hypothetical protein
MELEPVWTNDYKDIIYISPSQSTYRNLLEYGSKINESIDVSLSSYLNNLFLKNDHMKISIQIFESEKKFIKK